MADNTEFVNALKNAIKEKADYLNAEQLPKMLEHYRLLHTCVRNLYETLEKGRLITPDPYKLESKISDIEVPAETPFAESERAMVMGARFSHYESILDFVCTYLKFSAESLDITRIKKLTKLNDAFQWDNMTQNNSRVNTKGLATLIQEARRNAPTITLSLLNDSISKSAGAIEEITKILKDLMTYQREAYKLQLRLDIFNHPKFDKEKASESATSEIAEIKKAFPSIMGKKPYYSELVQEIANEDLAPNRQKLQDQTLALLKITRTTVKKKTVTIDYKAYLLDGLHALSGLSEVYGTVAKKIEENVDVIEGAKNTFFARLKKAFRQAFGIQEPPLTYDFTIVDTQKDTKSHRSVEIRLFISNINRKSVLYSQFVNKSAPEFTKVKNYPEEKILEFINKNVVENQEILTLLTAADDYFKQNVAQADRSKIKGLKMDLITIKNAIVKTVQKRTEYNELKEEQEQMKKLGIANEE